MKLFWDKLDHMMESTNIRDRFIAWAVKSKKDQSQELFDAFQEGFAQAMEWISGQTRS